MWGNHPSKLESLIGSILEKIDKLSEKTQDKMEECKVWSQEISNKDTDFDSSWKQEDADFVNPYEEIKEV